ncbi:Ubiquitin--protein ligase [Bertholletia excelsa]
MASHGSSYWCHGCHGLVRIRAQDSILCSNCGSGFLEEIDHLQSHRPRWSQVSADMNMNASPSSINESTPRISRQWRNTDDRYPFNPIVVLQSNTDAESGYNYEMYYDDGAGTGLRPLPESMSEFLMSSGFDRLLDQLTQLEINGIGRLDPLPASKAAIESLPTVQIAASYVATDSQCAVCIELFEINTEALEMPCKHIFHSDCIVPWLSVRNSCPVCRQELPADSSEVAENFPSYNGGNSVGLTIWTLPGGGFAVGRFNGDREAAELELPVVYTEIDGGFNSAGNSPRRIAWATIGRRARERSRITVVLRHVFSFFRRLRSASSRIGLNIGFRRNRSSAIVTNGPSRRRIHGLNFDDSGVTR